MKRKEKPIMSTIPSDFEEIEENHLYICSVLFLLQLIRQAFLLPFFSHFPNFLSTKCFSSCSKSHANNLDLGSGLDGYGETILLTPVHHYCDLLHFYFKLNLWTLPWASSWLLYLSSTLPSSQKTFFRTFDVGVLMWPTPCWQHLLS